MENEIKRDNKKTKILILIIVLVLLIGLCLGIYFLVKNVKNDNGKDKVKDNFYVNLSKVDKIDDPSNDVSDEEGLDENDEYDEYDGYYLSEENGGFYLKRNDYVVSKLEEADSFKLYKDPYDGNSKYIAVFYDGEEFELGEIRKGDYSFFETDSSIIFYNVYNGKIWEDRGEQLVCKFYNEDGYHHILVTKVVGEDKETAFDILNTNNFSKVNTKGYVVSFNPLFCRFGDMIVDNDKYIVATKNGKYGLIDYDGNVIIEAKYDNLEEIKTGFYRASYDDSYAIIAADDSALTGFVYDEIESVGKYYVVTEDDKLGVLDENGDVVVPVEIEFNSLPDDYHAGIVCDVDPYCGFASFETSMYDGTLIVIYGAEGRGEDENILNYLSVFEDGSYKISDAINYKYCTYSNDCYYVSDYYDNVSDFDTIEYYSKVNIYDKKYDKIGTVSCPANLYVKNVSVVDYRHMEISCGANKFEDAWGDEDEEQDYEILYFDLLNKKLVSASNVDFRYEKLEEITYDEGFSTHLSVLVIDSYKLVVDYHRELIFKLNKDDEIIGLDYDTFKIIRNNGEVSYYKMK